MDFWSRRLLGALLVTVLAGCGTAAEVEEEAGSLSQALSYAPGIIKLRMSSPKRKLVRGTDGGHRDCWCATVDTPWSSCTDQRHHHTFGPYDGIDGLQLRPDPNGSTAYLSGSSASVTVSSIEGPYHFEHGKWEWREGEYIYTYRRRDITSFKYSTGTSPISSVYKIRWDEDDGIGDDDFDWTVDLSSWAQTCQAKARGSYTIATGQRVSNSAYGTLCDSRGCSDGEYEIHFDVICERVVFGDGYCDRYRGENSSNSPADCPVVCGDGVCDLEGPDTCCEDCDPYGETVYCGGTQLDTQL